MISDLNELWSDYLDNSIVLPLNSKFVQMLRFVRDSERTLWCHGLVVFWLKFRLDCVSPRDQGMHP